MQRIDADALQRLIDAHGAALVLYARQWCHAPDDALQDALIELLRQEPAPEQPVAWLFQAVRRRAMNLARGERRRDQRQRRAAETHQEWFLDDRDPPVDGAQLADMLDRLPPLEREVVVARSWGELTFEQIAQLAGISTSAAHRRYRRALALLGAMMGKPPERKEPNHASGRRIPSRPDA